MTAADVRLRPLADWPYPRTATDSRRNPQFSASWSDTKKLLATEVAHLDGALVVVEFDVVGGEAAFRVDGGLRASAKAGDFPGVRVSFESRHGPLTYATDRYETRYYGMAPSWQANARAIALSLHALRAVDRHGVTRSGEQYRGWRAIESVPAEVGTFATAEAAARWMAEALVAGRDDPAEAGRIAGYLLEDGPRAKALYRQLVKDLHPDRGGDPADWARLDAAWRLVGGSR